MLQPFTQTAAGPAGRGHQARQARGDLVGAKAAIEGQSAGLVGRELVPLTLSAPPAGMTGAGRGGGSSATELLSIWPTLIDKTVVDPEVRVVLEEIK